MAFFTADAILILAGGFTSFFFYPPTQPRNDFRTSGSCTLLSSLLAYRGGNLGPAFSQSLIDMRLLVETETAALAAHFRTDEHLARFEEILMQENDSLPDSGALTELDFSFHLLIAVTYGNQVYPLIMNSFKSVYTHFSGQFFQNYIGTTIVQEVFAYYRCLVDAIAARHAGIAALIMKEMLQHGAKHLQQVG